MLIENLEIQRRLQRVVARFCRNMDLQQELMQEAMIHFWRMEERDPGKEEVWYLRGCRFHLRNVLRQGRSLDSLKRAQAQVPNWEQTLDRLDPFQLPDPNRSRWEEMSVNDFVAELSQWLTPREKETLDCLLDGLSGRETAKRLNISHTLVNRHRSRIATLALRLGISPLRNGLDPDRR